ncbi:pentapeptide repeat-containing protein [Nocardia sp. NPDC020380]|uniref:pentapeptide repeat-containing protein n=1 Tax=Nocardia sp. NPDC020380 TaxID=3364309 RepID=UPI0037BB4BBF
MAASLAAAVAVAGGLWFADRSVHAADDRNALARQTAVTERFSKGVEDLGNSSADIQIGGVYLLERLATDVPSDRSTIFEMLSTFVRMHAPAGPECGKSATDRPAPAVRTALTVIGRRSAGGPERIDLSDTCLANAEWSGANLQGARLDRADLSHADLEGADFTLARLASTDLDNANLSEAKLIAANADAANMQAADLTYAKLTNTILGNTDLRRARLETAVLGGTLFVDADLRGTILGTGTQSATEDPRSVRRAKAESKFGASDFSMARYDNQTVWPDGFVPVPDPDPTP